MVMLRFCTERWGVLSCHGGAEEETVGKNGIKSLLVAMFRGCQLDHQSREDREPDGVREI